MSAVMLDGAIRVSGIDAFTWIRVRPATTKTIQKTDINPPGAPYAAVEGDDYVFSAITAGNDKTYTQAESRIAFEVAAFADLFLDRTAKMEFASQIGASMARKLNSDAYAVLSDGFGDTGPDGVSLFSAAHPAETGGNQDNQATTALTEGNLQAALTIQRRMKTPDNILAGVNPSLLIVPPDLEYTARELVGAQIGTNTQANILATKGLGVLVTPEFSDATDWFLLDPQVFRAYQYVAKGSSPQQWIDMDSDNWRVKDRMSYTQGYDGWRGAWGAQVAA